MEGQANMIYAFRERADELRTTRAPGRFRSNTTLTNEERGDRVVAHAVARAKQGDREAVRFLYMRYADNVFGYVNSLVHDAHEAEDVTQHVFAKLMTVLPKYQQRDVPFSAWILRVARNVALDHLRRRRALPADEFDRPEDGYEDEAVLPDALSVRQALAALPDEQREVVVLRHVIGLTPGEIAERMGKTESSVHGLHHRGRGALRSMLTDLELAPATVAR